MLLVSNSIVFYKPRCTAGLYPVGVVSDLLNVLLVTKDTEKYNVDKMKTILHIIDSTLHSIDFYAVRFCRNYAMMIEND